MLGPNDLKHFDVIHKLTSSDEQRLCVNALELCKETRNHQNQAYNFHPQCLLGLIYSDCITNFKLTITDFIS